MIMEHLNTDFISSLKIRLCSDSYPVEIIHSYVQKLDLNKVEGTYKSLIKACNWYPEIVLNKKHYLKQNISHIFDLSEQKHLIIIPFAGKDPVALEILTRYYDKIDKVIEIDTSGMDEKKKLYHEFNSVLSAKIKCITADITNQKTFGVLSSLLHEYYRNHPTIIVLQDYTSFISRKDLENLIGNLKSKLKNNVIILDYLIPCEGTENKKREISLKINEVFNKEFGIDRIESYTQQSMDEIFAKNNAEKLSESNMMLEEKSRKGKNEFFNSMEESWIQFGIWKL